MGILGTQAVYTVRLGQSKALADGFFDRYNQDKPLGDRLRGQHKTLTGILVYYFSKEIRKAQAFGDGVREGASLPTLRTNNNQLARKLGTCEKTVRNLRKRLETARIILKTVFHGSNSSYELTLSPAILHISKQGDSENRVLYFSEAHAASDSFFDPKRKNLPHTVTRTVQDTIKLNKLEGVVFQQKPENQSIEGKKDVDKLLIGKGELPKTVENQQFEPVQATPEPDSGYEPCKTRQETAPRVAAHPPKVAPDTVAEAVAHRPKPIREKIQRHVDRLFSIALINLYDGRWLTDEEKEKGKARLAEYFAYSDPNRYTAGADEITGRIILVKVWIQRKEKKGDTRWTTPIPSAYFDIRNEKGFSQTKAWYKKHKAVRHEITLKTTVTKAVNFYMRSLEDGAKMSPSEAYRIITQRLGKRSQELVRLFNEQIAGLQKTTPETI
ncbi:MAG: hypothetical protein KDC85_23115 [Saprospiraceae bacterium]|nr:hypothetical protein [Saprospiraceae bacterium]MCB9322868.1 hypothetical protein [Lewinellaceae bacterium]